MEMRCPYCGSDEFEVYDIQSEDGVAVYGLCVCYDCDKTFKTIYNFSHIEKDD